MSDTAATNRPPVHNCPTEAQHDRRGPGDRPAQPADASATCGSGTGSSCRRCASMSRRRDSPTTGTSSTSAAARRAARRSSSSRRRPSRATAGSRPATWASGTTTTSSPWPGSPGSSSRRGPSPASSSPTPAARRAATCPGRAAASSSLEEGGWTTVAPSPIPFQPRATARPSPLDKAGIDAIVDAFEAAARRALEAGFRVIEIHSAHGYLLHEFLSPLTNQRDDEYGGSLENRMRLVLRVAERLRRRDARGACPCSSGSRRPTGSRAAGTSTSRSCSPGRSRSVGVDLIDCSSGAPGADGRTSRSARATRSRSPGRSATRPAS